MPETRATTLSERDGSIELRSPDGRLVVSFSLAEVRAEDGCVLRACPLWRVSCDGLPLLAPSRLAVEVAGEPPLATDFQMLRVRSLQNAARPQRASGGAASEMTVTLLESDGLRRKVAWTFRCSEDQVSVRFELPRQSGLSGLFCVNGDCSEWALPASAEAAGDAVTGAALVRYAHGRIAQLSGWGRFEADGARVRLSGGGAHLVRGPFVSEWRNIRLGRRPCDLADPMVAATCGGAIIRDDTCSTAGGLACVRLAAAVGARFVLYGLGWYGDPGDSGVTGLDDAPDARLTRRVAGWAGLDVPAVARAGVAAGVGVLLELTWAVAARSGGALLAQVAAWRASGVVLSGLPAPDAATAARLAAFVTEASTRGLACVIADAAWYALPLPGGAVAAVVEADGAATADEACRRIFSRGGLGVARVRAGWSSPQVVTTRAHQLALPIIFGGRFPILFEGCAPERVDPASAAVAVWRLLPRDGRWDETRWLRGEPGEYAVVARHAGERWLIAGITGSLPRVHTVRLEDVLPEGKSWRLVIHRDAHARDEAYAGDVVSESFDEVCSADKVRLDVAAGGGYVLVLEPTGRL